jgi:thymidylate synthase (FAD)
VQYTPGGVAYFTQPGVLLLAKPLFNNQAIEPFLEQFPPELEFPQYADDQCIGDGSEHGAELVKTAGQLCYMSFGPNRSKNADAQKYTNNILSSGHGSVLEHAQYTLLLWGAGRDFTHELVRHRTGVAFSQVSQRYVDGKVLRFVERPEYQQDANLHKMFVTRVDRTTDEYDAVARALVAKQNTGDVALTSEKKTEMRKKVNQAARSLLPNETEAPIVFSGNIRALRHVCEMRAAGAADVPIRNVTTRIFLCMQRIEPTLFNDYKLLEMADGTFAVSTDWRKV